MRISGNEGPLLHFKGLKSNKAMLLQIVSTNNHRNAMFLIVSLPRKP